MTTTGRIIYSAGYEGQELTWLARGAELLGATVVDVRLHARSSRPEWDLCSLRAALGERYVHLPAWGNKNYRAADRHKGYDIADWDKGLALFSAIEGPTILLCRCANPHACHRDELRRLLYQHVGGVRWEYFDWKRFTQPALF